MDALAPSVRSLPVSDYGSDGRWVAATIGHGMRLVIGDAAMRRDALADIALPEVSATVPVVSRSATTGARALLAAPSGRVGVDIETFARIALDASVDDAWLAPEEVARVARAARPVMELACCWVLKEAYGKALGVGLALPLDRIAFGVRGGMVAIKNADAEGCWDFGLYRHGGTLCGVAWSPAVQATPLAPAGRKPPMPLADR